MEVILNNGEKVPVSELGFKQWRQFMQEFMSSGKNGANKAWDLMSCVRGPDSPSETDAMSSEEHQKAYRGRRLRKFETSEAIRHEMFFGAVGGSARHHSASHVTVPPLEQQDHFDRHIVKAANLLGLQVKIKEG